MTPLAHAGHWAAQLLYLAPVLAMVGAIVWAKIRGRGEEDEEPENRQSLPDRSEWQPAVRPLRTSGVNARERESPGATMSSGDLRSLLDDVPDTWEIVLRREPEWSPVLHAWRDAAEEAAAAFAHWRTTPGRGAPTPPTAPPRTARTRPRTRCAQTQTSLTSVS